MQITREERLPEWGLVTEEGVPGREAGVCRGTGAWEGGHQQGAVHTRSEN